MAADFLPFTSDRTAQLSALRCLSPLGTRPWMKLPPTHSGNGFFPATKKDWIVKIPIRYTSDEKHPRPNHALELTSARSMSTFSMETFAFAAFPARFLGGRSSFVSLDLCRPFHRLKKPSVPTNSRSVSSSWLVCCMVAS